MALTDLGPRGDERMPVPNRQEGPTIGFMPVEDAPAEQLHLDRALPVWAVADRITYNRAKQELEKRFAVTARAVEPIARASQTLEAVRRKPLAVADFYDRTTGSEFERRQQAYDLATEEFARNPDRYSELVERRSAEGELTDVYTATYGRTVPGLPLVQQAVGQAGRFAGEQTRIPGAGAVGEFAGEAAVPTTVGGVAIEGLTGPTVIALARAARAAGKSVAEYTASEAGQALLKQLRSETGALRLPGGAVTGEVIPPENTKITAALKDIYIPDNERTALLRKARSRQAGELTGILGKAGDPRAILAEAEQALGGDILPRSRAIGNQFTDDEVTSYYRQIQEAPAKGLLDSPQAIKPAKNGLDLVLNGRRANGSDAPIMPHERKLLGQIFGPEFAAALPDTPQKLTAFQKLFAPVHLSRSIKTAFDLSAAGRQGKKLMFSNFSDWVRAWPEQFKAMASEEGFERGYAQVQASSYYDAGQALERPLAILRPGEGKTDQFLSPLSNKIQGLKQSERGFIAFLNYLRQAAFDRDMTALVRTHNGLENVPGNAIQDIADNINNATLYGNLESLPAGARAAAQTGFFSARGLASLPQYLVDVAKAVTPGTGVDPTVRRIVAARFASYVGAGMTSLAAANYIGYALNKQGLPTTAYADLNPYSDNFSEIRYGKGGSYNPWGAYQPIVRYALQIAGGQRQQKGELEPSSRNRADLGGRLIRSKLSPAAGILYDFTFGGGRDYRGRELSSAQPGNLARYALEQVAPIFFADVADAYREQGWMGVSGAAIRATGEDIESYEPTDKSAESAAKTEARRALQAASAPLAGGKLDFGADLLAKASWRSAIAEELGYSAQELGGLTYAEIRQKYIGEYAAVLKERNPDAPAAELKRQAEAAFGRFPIIDAFEKERTRWELEFWAANPDLLRQALDTKMTEPTAGKAEILTGQ